MVILSPLQRKAEFVKAAVLREMTLEAAARDVIGVSWQHLSYCFAGEREASARVRAAVADFVGVPEDAFWGPTASEAA